MQNKKIKTEYIIKTWIFVNLAMALAYFLVWLSSIFYRNLFYKLDKYFGYFPKLADRIFSSQIDINNFEISLSYVFISMFFVVISIAILLVKRNFSILMNFEKTIKKDMELKKEQVKNKKTVIQSQTPFFGLFEMNFEYLNSFNRLNNDLEKLKKEYFKILVNKLKEKYPNIQFIATNKIFIVSSEFEFFDNLLSDIVKIFAIFQKLNNEKFIGTSFLLSFEMGMQNTNHKKMYRLLSKVNDLSYYNQVIVLEKFAKKYKYILEKKFSSNVLDSCMIASDEFGEINVDLYSLEMNS